MSTPLHILFVYPTRGRRQRFIEGLQSIYDNIADRDNFTVLVNCDTDDPEMAGFVDTGNVKFNYGVSLSKVDAINRGPLPPADIICCMSDDMRFFLYGFDEIIRASFNGDLDQLLHFPDQDAGGALATMYIAGRPYYDRFGYIYHPSYASLYCDDEAQLVSQMLGRYQYINVRMFNHLNPGYGHLPKDDMFIEQQRVGYDIDQKNYTLRKAQNFDL